jgi:hypothetical protein
MQLQHEPFLQPESPDLSNPILRPTLTAHWQIENHKLVCHWIATPQLSRPISPKQ